jgi:hypothetical protein
MKIIEVESMYECPFQQSENVQIGEMTWDTNYTCKIRDGDDCDWEKCPMRIHKQYRVKWVGK